MHSAPDELFSISDDRADVPNASDCQGHGLELLRYARASRVACDQDLIGEVQRAGPRPRGLQSVTGGGGKSVRPWAPGPQTPVIRRCDYVATRRLLEFRRFHGTGLSS